MSQLKCDKSKKVDHRAETLRQIHRILKSDKYGLTSQLANYLRLSPVVTEGSRACARNKRLVFHLSRRLERFFFVTSATLTSYLEIQNDLKDRLLQLVRRAALYCHNRRFEVERCKIEEKLQERKWRRKAVRFDKRVRVRFIFTDDPACLWMKGFIQWITSQWERIKCQVKTYGKLTHNVWKNLSDGTWDPDSTTLFLLVFISILHSVLDLCYTCTSYILVCPMKQNQYTQDPGSTMSIYVL